MTPRVDIAYLQPRSRNTVPLTEVNQNQMPVGASAPSFSSRSRFQPYPPLRGPCVRQLLQTHLAAAGAELAASATPVSCLDRVQIVLPWTVGKYVLTDVLANEADWYGGKDTGSNQRVICKVIPSGSPRSMDLILAHTLTRDMSSINGIIDVVRITLPSSQREAKLQLSAPADNSDRMLLDCFVYRDVERMRLQDYIQSKAHLTEPEARQLFRQVVHLLQACHGKGIFLKDMKLRRVFVDPMRDNTQIMLMSLDNCTVLPSNELSDSSRSNRNGNTLKKDIWALGVILFAMVAGRYPFYDTDLRRLIMRVNTADFGPLPSSFSSDLKDLLRGLLHAKAARRPLCAAILEHPWLNVADSFPSESRETVRNVPDS